MTHRAIATLAIWTLVCVPAFAATFTVDSTVDAVDAVPGDGVCATAAAACTLRAAVMEANALAGADAIDVPAGTYALTITGAEEDWGASGDLDLRDPVAITGAGSAITLINGAAQSLAGQPIFSIVDTDLAQMFSISDLSIVDGAIFNGMDSELQLEGPGTVDLARITFVADTAPSNRIFNFGVMSVEDLDTRGAVFDLFNNFSLLPIPVVEPVIVIDGWIHDGNFGSTLMQQQGPGSLTVRNASLDVWFKPLECRCTSTPCSVRFENARIRALQVNAESIKVEGCILDVVDSTIDGFSQNLSILSDAAFSGGNNPSTATIARSAVVNSGSSSEAIEVIDSDLALIDSLVADNTNAGVHIRQQFPNGFPTLTTTNTTFSGNGGYGVRVDDVDLATFTNATFSNNATGALWDTSGAASPVAMTNTIVDGVCTTPTNLSATYSIETANTCGFNTSPASGNQVNTDPMLLALADNGGPTRTHALGAGSPAIDAGDDGACPARDQRGFVRHDGACDIGAYENGADGCIDGDEDGYSPVTPGCGAVDCDDTNPEVNPGATEICNNMDDNCDGTINEGFSMTDGDSDGFPIDCDCDDGDPGINPGAAEICDGIDQDCDTLIDEGFDLDGDSYTTCGGDCDDDDPAVHPGAAEIPGNGVDENCNGNDLCGSIPLARGGEGPALAMLALAGVALLAAARRRR